ncbi:MAG: bifunctional UDP-3-O-[3-hydroxymyristoyl] N-acetylglucosamine deacetylase/3-hydroxyacyl-ACP dehydratase [Candidatus Omnitrophica bacterium]|nr:bifunctional UDP-3-O-[3-hydroxymyristoyl] N-acetylglucosamine deacetylase/3-hydroxyacyl-ACP dehydratase [Candidatus Omnitrophota bacterium]
MQKQRTIAKPANLSGVGLHSGEKVNLSFKPAPINSGIIFERTDLAGCPTIKVSVDNLKPKEGSLRYSCLEKDDIKIYTIEHLLAALNGLGIDNLIIQIDAEEVPGLDGSSRQFVEVLEEATIIEQDAPRFWYTLAEALFVQDNGASLVALPSDELKISYTLDYNHPYIAKDFMQIVVTEKTFKEQLASARTFCLAEEVEVLRSKGLGKGANYINTLVVGEQGIIKNKLRFENEFVRHKIMDLLGDLYLLGSPLKAHIIALRSGHSLNLKLVQKIKQHPARPAVEFGEPPFIGEDGSMDVAQVMRIIPHRDPFLFVDKIISMEKGKRIVGVKYVRPDEYFFRGHFPQRPVMPGVLILEAMAQVGGVMMLSQEENRGKLAFFMMINNAKFRRPVLPGDELVFEVIAGKIKSRTGTVHGVAKVAGNVVAEAELMFAVAD